MESEFPTLQVWDQFKEDEARTVGRHVGRLLPPGWACDGVAFHELGDQRRFVALFRWSDARFALIPGGTAALGYDRSRPLVLSPTQRASWEASQPEYGWDLARMLDRFLTPQRQVTLMPFLMETRFRALPPEAETGFRLPTSDEWEYGCAAGSRTLFRWGEDFPSGRAVGWTRRNVQPTWDLHKRPNAFGLTFPTDTVEAECCLEVDDKSPPGFVAEATEAQRLTVVPAISSARSSSPPPTSPGCRGTLWKNCRDSPA